MKKSVYTVLILTFLLSAMAAFATDSHSVLMQKMLKPVITQSCKSELKDSKLWQSAAFFMNIEHQTELEKEICGCVSDNALNNISAQDLARATINESAKNSLIKQAVLNSVKGCAQKAIQ